MQTQNKGHAIECGHLSVHVSGHADVEPTLHLTLQGSSAATEHHPFHKDHKIELDLAPGTYLGQVTAGGHFPASFAVTIDSGKTARQTVELKKGSYPVEDFATRLKAYGFSPADAVDKIELKPREHRIATPGRGGTNIAKLQSLKQVRQFVGAPAGVFGHDAPRFQPVTVPKGLYGRLLERKPTPEDAAAVTALVNEYVNGNERAYASVLNDQFLSLVSELANSSIIYTLAQTLYIAPGATYTFSGSLVIDTIRISKTGNLHPTNVFKVDATNWIEF